MAEHFDALITFGKTLERQQDFRKFPIAVFILSTPDNTCQTMRQLIPALQTKFSQPLKVGITAIKL